MAAFETNTNRITAVAIHATSETAVPTLPSAGDDLDLTTSPGGWAEVGFEFADDAFKYSEGDRKRLEVWPPAAPMKTRIIEKPPSVSSFEFTSYEVGAKLYAHCTNMSVSNGTYEALTEHSAYRALMIEIGGVGVIYFPKVTIEASLPSGGVWNLNTQGGKVEVFGTDTIPSGYQWYEYQ